MSEQRQHSLFQVYHTDSRLKRMFLEYQQNFGEETRRSIVSHLRLCETW